MGLLFGIKTYKDFEMRTATNLGGHHHAIFDFFPVGFCGSSSFILLLDSTTGGKIGLLLLTTDFCSHTSPYLVVIRFICTSNH